MAFEHPLLVCPVCGTQFRPKRDTKEYCSTKCQKRAYNQRMREQRALERLHTKRVKVNEFNLKRLLSMEEHKGGISRTNLRTGGVDMDVQPVQKRDPVTNETINCYGDYCIKLKDPEQGIYLIIHHKN